MGQTYMISCVERGLSVGRGIESPEKVQDGIFVSLYSYSQLPLSSLWDMIMLGGSVKEPSVGIILSYLVDP